MPNINYNIVNECVVLGFLQVAGVPMTILHTSTIFEKKWIASQIDTAVACPTGQLVYVTCALILYDLKESRRQ